MSCRKNHECNLIGLDAAAALVATPVLAQSGLQNGYTNTSAATMLAGWASAGACKSVKRKAKPVSSEASDVVAPVVVGVVVFGIVGAIAFVALDDDGPDDDPIWPGT